MSSAKTTRLYLVRHGATQASAEDRFAGAIDVELSEEGAAQAHALGGRLREVPISAVYSSPMKRTLATAREIADPRGLGVTPHDGFREIAHGHWENRARRDVQKEFADEYKRWEMDPYTFAPAGGETGLSVVARAYPAVCEAIRKHAGGHVVIVSHKATIRLVLCALLGMDARGYRDYLDLSPASLSVVDFRDEVRGRLVSFNDTSHYERTPGTPEPRLSSWWDNH